MEALMSQGQFHLQDLRFCGFSLILLFLSVVKLVIQEVMEIYGPFSEDFKSMKSTIESFDGLHYLVQMCILNFCDEKLYIFAFLKRCCIDACDILNPLKLF